MAGKTSAEIWAEVIDTVERSLGGNSIIWLRQTRAESFSNGVLSVTVQNAFTKNYIEEEYLKQIRSALKSITSADTEVNFIIKFETPTTEETDPKKKDTFVAGSVDPASSLNPKYTLTTLQQDQVTDSLIMPLWLLRSQKYITHFTSTEEWDWVKPT